ncbi:hypothetical protein GCM10018952_56280 [Streptosporangium vulgare]
MVGDRQAELVGGRGGGERVLHRVLAVQAQADRGGARGGAQREGGASPLVDGDVLGPHGRALGPAVPGDAGAGALRHRGHQRVVGVEHGHALGGQRLDQLALGPGDLRLAAEDAQVGGADVEDHADPRRGDAGPGG